MNITKYVTISCLLLSFTCEAQQTYCPGNHGMIDIGMTVDQVLSACGTPTARQQSNTPVMQKVPVTQLIYSTLNQPAIYQGLTPVYNMFSLPNGVNGTSLQFNVLNNKVRSINMNGSSVNSASICSNGSVQIGDDINAVYNACGSPSLVNNTYINQPIQSKNPPETWLYQNSPYTPVMRLTFIDGILQSIQ